MDEAAAEEDIMVSGLEEVMIEVHEALAEAIVDDTDPQGSIYVEEDAEDIVDTSAALIPANMGGTSLGRGPDGGAAPAGTGRLGAFGRMSALGAFGGLGVLGGFAGSGGDAGAVPFWPTGSAGAPGTLGGTVGGAATPIALTLVADGCTEELEEEGVEAMKEPEGVFPGVSPVTERARVLAPATPLATPPRPPNWPVVSANSATICCI